MHLTVCGFAADVGYSGALAGLALDLKSEYRAAMRILGARRVWAVMALATIAAAAAAAGAQAAKPYEHLLWHEEADFLTQRCGVDVRIEFSEGGTVLGRAPGKDGVPRYTVKWRGDAVWTNVATERTFTFEWRLAEQDVKAVDNGDGTTTLLYQHAGPEHVYGPDGQRLYLWVGLGRESVLIDNGGTPTNPYDDAFISEDFLSFHGRPDVGGDFCTTFRELTG